MESPRPVPLPTSLAWKNGSKTWTSLPAGTAFGEDFDRSGNDGQNIIQVVGDAAGQLTDHLHFLGLTKLLLNGIVLTQQTVPFLDKGRHSIHGRLESCQPRGRGNSFGE